MYSILKADILEHFGFYELTKKSASQFMRSSWAYCCVNFLIDTQTNALRESDSAHLNTLFRYLHPSSRLTMSFLFSRKMESFLRKETTTSSSSSSSRSRIFTSMWTMFLFLIFSSVRVSSARFSSRHRATTGSNAPETTGSFTVPSKNNYSYH